MPQGDRIRGIERGRRTLFFAGCKICVVPAIIRIFSPVKVQIFGSRVNGTATKDSDIDVIIVAETFAGISFVRRMSMVMKSARFKKHVDYLCYTPEEFERLKNTSGILKDAVSSAIEVPL